MVKANIGVEVAFAEVGGWDTHANQGGAQGQLAPSLVASIDLARTYLPYLRATGVGLHRIRD